MTDKSSDVAELLPCPLCAQPMSVNNAGNARCDTPDCWFHESRLAIPVFDKNAVRRWNTRTPAIPQAADMGELADELLELRNFLDGSASLDGLYFGESAHKPAWWWRCYLYRIDNAIAALRAQPPATDSEALAGAREYNELLMAVESKCPNETRHETALRYIREREQLASESLAQIDSMKENKDG